MAGLVFGCIAPHGSHVIAELAGALAPSTAATRGAMEELGRRMEAARPDTLVVLTPHGVRVAGRVCVMTTDRAYGILEDDDSGGRIEVDMAVDTELARRIAERAATVYHVPTATATYGSTSGEACYTPLDWGAVVPLWFLGARWNKQPSIVSITPTRSLSLRQLNDFGYAIAEAAVEVGRRVALIASADWGHAHDPNGPYGFDRASAQFDAMVVDTIKADELHRLLKADLNFAERAKVDGLWQAVMLAGAQRHTPLRGELLSYEVPSYFGMMVAAYEPVEPT